MWIIAAVVCFVIEAATVNLVSIWLGISAMFTAILASYVESLFVQFAFFVILTGVLLYFTRPLIIKYIKPKATNAPSLKGREGLVTKSINNLEGTGQVKLNGVLWTARSLKDDEIIEKGVIIIVKEIRGVSLIVERKAV